ncbi:MAG: 50S ribosomal protein L29 [Dysgonomonas sp.]
MKSAEVRELTDKELAEKLAAERVLLDQMVINHSVTPLDSPADIRKKRKTIARLLTEIRQRELNK